MLTVRLTAAGSPEWRYLALEDPLPAGVEAIQDTTAYPLERQAPESWWYGSRVEYRDSKTVFFQEAFERGRYEYAYLVKVIAPGQFRAIPAQISPMYVPGVHASSEPQSFTIAVPAACPPSPARRGIAMRLVLAALWILLAAVLTAGAYWGFLITPESTIWSLIVSALLADRHPRARRVHRRAARFSMWWQGASIAGVKRALAVDPRRDSGRGRSCC